MISTANCHKISRDSLVLGPGEESELINLQPTDKLGHMRIVVLLSGSGSNFQAVIDAVAAGKLDVEIAAAGSDVPGAYGLKRAQAANIPTFVTNWDDYSTRDEWTTALIDAVAAYQPDLVVSSGLMRILGPQFLEHFHVINTHPALLPSFPGAHGVRDALSYGVKITGCTVHQVDAGVDTGPILAQTAVEVLPEDTEESLHERIKVQERRLLLEVLAHPNPLSLATAK